MLPAIVLQTVCSVKLFSFCSDWKQSAQATIVKGVLNTYAVATGQLINPAKCSILFSGSCSSTVSSSVKNVLEVTQEVFDPKYLGLPVPEGRMSKDKFQSLQERLSRKLIDWCENYMSSASKEILIKAVAQAIPTYVMSVFKLPAAICDDLTKLIRQYWWGVEKGKRKMAWLAWDKMIMPKCKGGIGFRDMRAYNQALLAKQAWRIIENPESLCARLLKAKYFPNGSLVDTVFTGNSSSVWKGIEHGLELVKKGMIWRVGNGSSIRTWRDPWIPRGTNFRPISPKRQCRLNRVSDFINEYGAWNEETLKKHFCLADVSAILKIRTSPRLEQDFIAWGPDPKGIFTVRSAYRLAMYAHEEACAGAATSTRPNGDRPVWNLIWKSKVPHKIDRKSVV